ncbi:MAG TPA: flagellar basal body-associated FliL family protein [Arsenophonus sp.]
MHLDITLRLTSEETRKCLHNFMPEVRSRLLLLSFCQKAAELATDTGKVHLMSEIKQVLKPTFKLEESEQIITDVLFTTFILL